MSRFEIIFTRPWLLLLFIPLAAVSLIPVSRGRRKKRRGARTVLPLCIYMLTLALAVLLAAGVSFRTRKVSSGKNVIFLVDVSDSTLTSRVQATEFISDALSGADNSFNVGLVTFGAGQTAVESGGNMLDAWKKYEAAGVFPDPSATDISSALRFAASAITEKDDARIILVSDGMETDGDAARTAQELLKSGIAVSGIYLNGSAPSPEIQISSMNVDRNVKAGIDTGINILLRSTDEGEENAAGTDVKVYVYDNGSLAGEAGATINGSEEKALTVTCSFSEPGLHVITARLEAGPEDDFYENNNVFYEYVYVEGGKKILIVDGSGSEAPALTELLSDEYDVDVRAPGNVPASAEALGNYAQVVLMNVDAALLPSGFDELLYNYVNYSGGGLLVSGGDQSLMFGNMENTRIAELLPVTLEGGNKSLELMIVLDISASMNKPMSTSNANPRHNRMYYAKEGVNACLDALTDNDFVGIVTFSATSNLLLPITPATANKSRITEIVNNIQHGAGTLYSVGLQTAQNELFNSTNKADLQHVIFITDGNPAQQDWSVYPPILRSMRSRGITVSTVAIIDPQGAGKIIDGVEIDDQWDIESLKTRVVNMAADGGGNYYFIEEGDGFADIMREETQRLNKSGLVAESCSTDFRDYSAATAGIVALPGTRGHYAVTAKDGAATVLEAGGDPLYVEWEFGAGKVGCFSSDLGNTYANQFLTNEFGKRFIKNIVTALPGTGNDGALSFEDDNYTKLLTFSSGSGDETNYAKAFITSPDGAESESTLRRTEEGYAGSFTTGIPGVYTVTVREYSAGGDVLLQVRQYTAFSYSREYDLDFAENGYLNMLKITSSGGGLYQKGDLILEQKPIVREKVFDPKPVILVVMIVLFLFNIFFKKFILPRK